MPAQNTKKTSKNFNPTFGVFFPDDRFGKGALVSAPLNETQYQAIMQNIELGRKLVIKPAKSKSGKAVSFGEILPQFTGKTSKETNSDI